MGYAPMAAATAAALAFSLAGTGCEAPNTDDTSPKQIPGVTFLGGKAHPVKIFGLSADGRAAVGYVFDADKEPPPGAWTDSAVMPDYAHSYHWTEAGGLKIIRTRDGGDVEVRAISADGTTAAGRFYDKASSAHVFRWTEAGGIEDLGTPDDPHPVFCMHGGCGAEAKTVSADGAVIFGTLQSGTAFGSFRWTHATGVRNLHIPGEIRAATPDGSTGVGVTYVDAGHDHVVTHVFRWTLARGFEDLGAPPSADTGQYDYVTAEAVSADGSTIVGEYGPGAGETRGYRWTQSGGFRDLSGEGGSTAHGVSADGSQIVGVASGSKGYGSRPVRWLGDNPPQAVGPPGLHAIYANSISADGRTIAGSAFVRKGDARAFLLRLK